MSAYLIFIREGSVVDAEVMGQYQNHTRTSPPKVPTKPLIVYGKIEALEGTASEGMVVLEFADSATARAWYESDEYQAAIPLRQRAAEYRVMLVEGFAMPGSA